MLLAGLAVAVTGVYAAIAKQTLQALSAKAHDVLIEAISNWADEDAAKTKDATAEAELKLKASIAEVKAARGSTLWRTITWPFRSAAEYVDKGSAKADKASPKPTDDSK